MTNVFPKKILLATDGSKAAELASSAAIALANKTHAELHVVYVGAFVPSSHIYPASKLEQIIGRITHRSQTLLGERIGLIGAAGGDVSGDHVRVGRPAEEIVALAEEIEADLIVMGNRGLGGVRRALMGSVSDSVTRYAHCPVMVVRGAEKEERGLSLQKILLATDGSNEATLAAEAAAGIARLSGSELHVVHVEEYTPPILSDYGSFAYIDAEAIQTMVEEVDSEARKILDEQVGHIEGAGGSVTSSCLRQGRPDREIIDLAEKIGAGLIVMGSRGQGGVRRTLMGSVSDSIVRHAHCPVLVARNEKSDKQSR
jgi:nucleotide-binding universal stress UspA family protein